MGPNGERNQANSGSNSNLQNQFGNLNSGTQTLASTFDENGIKGSQSSASSFSSSLNNGNQRGRRSVDDTEDPVPEIRSNRQKRQHGPHHYHHHGGFPGQSQFGGNFNPYQQQPNFGFQQQNANGNAFAQNQNPFNNQNSGANTQSSNVQNQFGNFQNNGGSSIASNIANGGLAGDVSAANTDQQSYQTAQGSGQKNNAQGQSAHYDQFGNLDTSAANSGK